MLSFAEFEREMIKERTAAGKAIARQKSGYKEGRPKQSVLEIRSQEVYWSTAPCMTEAVDNRSAVRRSRGIRRIIQLPEGICALFYHTAQ